MISRYEHLYASVSSIYHDIQRIERTEMAKFGLKGPYAQCLLAMSRHPEGITAGKLCQVCEKDKAAISRTVSELEGLGMVRRESRNGGRYRSLLMLTEKGIAAAQTVNEKSQLAIELAGAGLNDEHRQIFYQVMALIADNLHAICRDGLQRQGNREREEQV